METVNASTDRRESVPSALDAKGSTTVMTDALLSALPLEVLISVACHLGAPDLALVAATCTVLYATATDEAVWQHRVRADYGRHPLLGGEPTNADLARMDRTWRWLYRVYACHSSDAPPQPSGAVANTSACYTYAGDRGPDGALDGPGVRVVSWDTEVTWSIGRWTKGVLSGPCRIVRRRESKILCNYDGEAADDVPNGHGVDIDQDGTRYVGQWRDGYRSGTGTSFWPNGSLCYAGEWADGRPHGRGLLIRADGARIEGEFASGNIDGHATFTFPHDRGNHVGMWRAGIRHGPGRETDTSGSILDATWNDGEIAGDARCVFSCGTVYDGPWMGHGPHGIGRTVDKRGTTRVGPWERGDVVGDHTITCGPTCCGRPGHDHDEDARISGTLREPHDALMLLIMPNGDHLSFDDKDHDGGDGERAVVYGTLRYRVSDRHPTLGGRLLVCAGRRISTDLHRGFGVAKIDCPDAVAIAELFATGWTCYGDVLLRMAVPDHTFEHSIQQGGCVPKRARLL